MKKLIITAATFMSIALIVNSCKKKGGDINPLSSVTNNSIGSYLVLDKNNNPNLDYSQISTSAVSLDVHYYPAGEPVTQVILYATQGSSLDTNDWHLVKTVPYTSPTTNLSVTGTELSTALGVALSTLTVGNNYTIYTRIVTKSGKTYDVNNTGDNSGSGLISGIAYASVFFFSTAVICPYDVSTATGTYKIVKDGWTAFASGVDNTGETVTVTAIGADSIDISAVWPGPDIPGAHIVNHLVIGLDPASGAAVVPQTNFGYYPPSVGDFIATASGGAGFVFSCTGTITLTIDVIAGGFGDQGNFNLVLQKQ